MNRSAKASDVLVQRRPRSPQVWPAACLTALLCGCGGGPSTIRPPSIDADDAATEAMTLYDKDGDGTIAGAELDAAPGLRAGMATLDANKNKAVEKEEIVQRIKSWKDSNVGIVSLTFNVTLDGRPVEGAKIVFEPEPFLSDDIQAAEGLTSPVGATSVSIPKENRPTADTPPGVQLGFYRVRITKEAGGKETIPTKYNAQTTLGKEVAPDDPDIMAQRLRFELTSK